jgi:2-dehydro-3-deoxy-D-arabinonate dehydratase
MVHLFRTRGGTIARVNDLYHRLRLGWDELFTCSDPHEAVAKEISSTNAQSSPTPEPLLAPIGSQEVWAAGVTYYRSRNARIDESRSHGGKGDCYERVYDAVRPELFFKATPNRVVGDGQDIRIRQDSNWNVPEPELTMAVNSNGRIIGYTIGNDVSSRDIEGQNPLYLPQAKVYDQCCGLGPGLLLTQEPLSPDTAIELSVLRNGTQCFYDLTTLSEMKRTLSELVAFCFRENSFPTGCFLMTGTGIVPPADFTLQPRDVVRITIEPIGTLTNAVVGQN